MPDFLEGALIVNRIIDEVIDSLHGYVRDQEQATFITTPITPTALQFNVAESNQVSRGTVEVDDELMYVQSVSQAGLVTVMPWGRGQSNTEASDHAVNAKLTQSPLYPRRRVADALFGVLREIFPLVYGVLEAFYDVNIVRTNYPLPDDVYDVLSVYWHVPGPSQMWKPMRSWRIDRLAATQEIELLGPLWPGIARVRIMYVRRLPDEFGTIQDLRVLGYSQDQHDLFVLGTVAKLLLQTEASRLQVESVTSHGRSEVVPAGSISKVANNIYAMFQARVRNEADRLLQRYGNIPHFTRM